MNWQRQKSANNEDHLDTDSGQKPMAWQAGQGPGRQSCELGGKLSGVEAHGWSYGSGHKVCFLNHILPTRRHTNLSHKPP